MDPLSITASVIAVAGLAASTGRAFQDLRSLCKTLPGRLHALSNEVADIELVLYQVASVFEQRGKDPVLQEHALSIPKLVEGAELKLEELRSIIRRLSQLCKGTRAPLYGAYTWRKDQPRLQSLQDDIRNIKCSLNIMLGASNSQDMMRIRLDIKAITTSSTQAASSSTTLQDIIQADLARHHDRIDNSLTHVYKQVDQRIGAVEKMLEAQSAQLAASQSNLLGNFYGPRYRRRPRQPTDKGTQYPNLGGGESVAIVRMSLTYEQNLGPHFEISTLRRVPDSAQCVTFALNGNIEGLKDLFRRGLASPRDVSSTRGYSVVRWAMYGKQFETCKFLVHAGADIDYRPIAASDNSPRHKAHQFLLMGGLSDSEVAALRCLTQDSDFIDNQNYTILHRIVLGLSMQDLEEELSHHSELIDTPDAMGRTALAWAAARGDERSIVTLLQHGAEVNTIDVQYSGIVGHAADRNYVTCVRLVLEAGADPDIAASHGHRVGNPLNVAARNASDPLILKTLLDFGADVESSGVDGTTALIHAARKNNVNFATVLLEHGADINAVSSAGQTPLTTAVIYNSHNVLQLLLDRWFEYSECPRLKGPHLLQIIALYADPRTMEILTGTDHLVIKYDASYALGDFASRLNDRPDATEKLIQAFQGLLSVINRGPEMHRSPESLMESGLASPDCWTFNRSDTLGSDQDFVDALETFHLATRHDGRSSCPASPTSPTS
ncbi:MAG: hypothetical protein Q9170_003718 [Blastenia crenularia]